MVNKFLKSILCLMIGFTIISANSNNYKVSAATDYPYYPMSCPAFEVSIATSSGTFNKVECFDNFYSAKDKMNSLGNDAVVRHKEAYSPSKIIAVKSGVAVSYPQRSGKNTANITQYINNSGKSTYVTYHRDMAYFSTDEYYNNGDGKLHINLTGFDGYISLKEVDLVPMVFIYNQVPIYLGGNDATPVNEQPFNTRIYPIEYNVVNNGNYKELVFVAHSGWSKDGWPQKWAITLGPAADWMNVGTTYYSYNGYDFYSNREYTNKVNTYYNYYQFLPLRTQSDIPADAYNKLLQSKNRGDSKLINTGQDFINNQNAYGVNAALTFAMACLESGYGTSRYATERNNLFGWNAFDSDPNNAAYFSSISQGIYEHMAINLRGYIDITDFRFFGMHLGNKGSGLNVKYAGDPYWGYKIASIAYELDKAANNYNGNLTDFNKYKLGLVDNYNTSVYRSNSTGSGELFKSAYGNTYQVNYIVPILSQDGSWIKAQSNNGIRDDFSLVVHKVNNSIQGAEGYNWNKSVGFIESKFVKGINTSIALNTGKVPTGDFIFNVSKLGWENEKLSIQGNAYRPGIFITNENKITHKLKIVNKYYEEVPLELTTTVKDNVSSYSNNLIDLTNLPDNTYYLKVETEYSLLKEFNNVGYVNLTSLPPEITIKNKQIKFENINNETWFTVKTVTDPKPSPSASASSSPSISPSVSPDPSISPSPSVSPSPSPSATPSETPAPKLDPYILQFIDGFEYTDETKTKVKINGFALIKDMDATKDTEVKHQILIRNLETGEETPIDAITSLASKPMFLNDKFTYEKIRYEAEIDLQSLPIGDYSLVMSLTNGQTNLKSVMTGIDLKKIPSETTIDDKHIKFTQRQMNSYRYEISVYNYGLDLSTIKKPTRRDSIINSDSILVKDNNLVLKGASWIYMANYTEKEKTTFNLILLSTTTGETTTYPLTVGKCKWDYTKLLASKYELNYACFDQSIDISALPVGKYQVYLENSVGEHKDIMEYYNIRNPKIQDVVVNNKTYKLTFNKTRSRLTLEIIQN